MSILDYDNNQELCNDSIIVIKDKDSCSIRLINSNKEKVYKVKVDNGLIQDKLGINSLKCDHMIYSYEQNKLVVYIELKGKNIENAIKQLESTINITKKDFRDYEKKKAYISSNTSPKTTFRKKQIEFIRSNRMPLSICNPKDDNNLWD